MKYKKAKLCKAKSGWYAWFEYKNPQTGLFEKHIRKCGINRIKSINDRKREFGALIDAINQLLADGWAPISVPASSEAADLQNRTLLECLQYLLKIKEETLAKHTFEHYRSTVRGMQEFLESRNQKYIFPKMFGALEAVAYGDYMLLTKGYSGKTFNGYRSDLKTLFNEMNDRLKIFDKNPISKIRKQYETETSNKPFTPQQRLSMKSYFVNHRPELGHFCQFIYYCGLRPKEILGIRIEDIKLKQNSILIYGGNAKNRKQIAVTIPDALVSLIESMNINQYQSNWFLFGERLKPGPKQWDRHKVSKIHRKALIKAGIFDLDHKLYSWKHTGAIESFMIHKDPYKIMKQLRHHSLEITMKYLRSLGLNVNFTYEIPTF